MLHIDAQMTVHLRNGLGNTTSESVIFVAENDRSFTATFSLAAR